MDESEWLKTALKSIDDKVDGLGQRLEHISDVQRDQASDLREHITRTEIAEENISLLREQIQPIEKHVAMVHGVLKFVGLLATVASLVTALIKVIEFFSNRS